MSKNRAASSPSTCPEEAEVVRLSHDGRGIAQINGKTVFITGALPQEHVSFKYTQRQSQFDQGQLLEVIRPSPERVVPKCPHADICGGCRLQHLDAKAQIIYKQGVLVDQLWHFGKLKPPEQWMDPLVAEPWGYRRKARLSVKYVHKKNKLLVGFHEKQGRYVADLTVCEVLHPIVGKNVDALQKVLSQLSIVRAIPQIEVAVGDNAAVLILRHLEPLTDTDKKLLLDFGIEQGLTWYLQPGNPSSIMPLDQPVALNYTLPAFGLTLAFRPLDFVQINAAVNQQLVSKAVALLDPQPHEHILDLFCGLGNFSLPLAQYAQQVVGVEGDMAMVKQAESNAALNQLSNTAFYMADLSNEKILNAAWAQRKYDKLLLDPPRTGAWEIVSHIKQWDVQRIVYVSCNPATFARDAGELVHQQGYRLTQLGVLDMFPHTQHVEAIGVFEKN